MTLRLRFVLVSKSARPLGVACSEETTLTRPASRSIDRHAVKGTAMKYDWVVNTPFPDRHFVVRVTFEGAIDAPSMPPPRVWIFPLKDIAPFMKRYAAGRMNAVSRSLVINKAQKYEGAWQLIDQ